MGFIPSKNPDTRVKTYYIFDSKNQENIIRFDTLEECQKRSRKMNKKEGYKRYYNRSSIMIVKNRN